MDNSKPFEKWIQKHYDEPTTETVHCAKGSTTIRWNEDRTIAEWAVVCARPEATAHLQPSV